MMEKRRFLEVTEFHEDHVTLVLFCPQIGADITGTFYGPFVTGEDLFESEVMPIKLAIDAAERRAKSKGCDVVVSDPQKLWDPADGDLV